MIISKDRNVLDSKLKNNLKLYKQEQTNYYSVSGNWVNAKNIALISTVSQMNVHIIEAYGNNYNKIFIQIKEISFPRLKFLNIWGNNIESIQGFARLNAPDLKDVWIWNNHIRSIRELRKISNMTLRQIDMKQNPILDHQFLSQIPVTVLQRLHINPLAPKNYLAKVQPNKIDGINQNQGFYGNYAQKYSPIRNKNLKEVLDNKFFTERQID